MSQSLSSQKTPLAAKKAARKRYEAPQLEAYGTVQELTLTSSPGYYSGGDVGTYYVSTPPS